MNKFLTILPFIFFLFACNTTKRISTTNNNNHTSQSISSHSIISRDTLISIPHKIIDKTFTEAELRPITTNEKQIINRVYRIDTNGLRATITAMVDGSLRFTCEADSLKLVIQNLIREKETIYRKDSTTTKVVTTTKTKVKNLIANNIIPIALLIVLLLIGLKKAYLNKYF